ncbi:hypothetical protein ABE488_09155 [Luteimonas sp. TWI662]|uniref:hypothetical protein n=1 Tax=Luteimonas sp. TWI662 TaxID=3136789 RepID=UPI003209FF9A
MSKINPEWVRYNNLFNEGYADSYNPHPKHIAVAPAAVALGATAPAGKVYRDSRGMQIDPVALIAEAEDRFPFITDAFARKLVEQSIAHYRKMLEA